MVALPHLDYLLTAFQTHHPTSATSTHGTSARKTISTSSTTKGRDGSALGERLRLIGHEAPARDQGHRFRDRRPSKPLWWGESKVGRTEEGSTGTTQEICAHCITGKTLSQKRKWAEATSPSDRLSDLHHP